MRELATARTRLEAEVRRLTRLQDETACKNCDVLKRDNTELRDALFRAEDEIRRLQRALDDERRKPEQVVYKEVPVEKVRNQQNRGGWRVCRLSLDG